MLEPVEVGVQSVDRYAPSAGADVIASLRDLAAPLAGLRVLHVNATPYGGGVAEILRSEIPLLRDLGLLADWKLIRGDDEFFSVTRAIHNGLQGSDLPLTGEAQATYLAQSERNAELLEEEYDVVVVHDPQPLALRELHGRGDARWVWRCHIDTSEPNEQVWAFLRPFVARYDAAVFTLGGFVPPDFPLARVEIVPPAIDPESPKNVSLTRALATRLLDWLGVDVERPLVVQVSRFDPWKDPGGVIAAFRLAREQVPDLGLVLAGSMALDDPEGWDVYRALVVESHHDPAITVLTNLTGVGNVEVNALQRLASVVVQKSLREGFGLVVSEALWKGTPVVAGRAGGIPLQLQDGTGGYLVDSVEECAERILDLLRDPARRDELGAQGRELVRQRFLLPRLVADELRLYTSILGERPAPGPAASAGLAGEDRDPVCGMRVVAEAARRIRFGGRDWLFCSRACESEFARDPDRFQRAATARG